MRKCTYSAEREKIVAEAICPVATELRLLDAADLVSLLRFECYGNLADLVSSAAELYFLPGTVNFGAGGDLKVEGRGQRPAEGRNALVAKLGDLAGALRKRDLDEILAGIEIEEAARMYPGLEPLDDDHVLARDHCLDLDPEIRIGAVEILRGASETRGV